jgi:hypothetical protein
LVDPSGNRSNHKQTFQFNLAGRFVNVEVESEIKRQTAENSGQKAASGIQPTTEFALQGSFCNS